MGETLLTNKIRIIRTIGLLLAQQHNSKVRYERDREPIGRRTMLIEEKPESPEPESLDGDESLSEIRGPAFPGLLKLASNSSRKRVFEQKR